MFRSLLTGRPGARAVVCILMTDSHISIVLVPANIISAEGFISGRDGDGQGEGLGGGEREEKKKQPSFFKSQVISVLWRVKLYRGRFFFLSATKGFMLLLIWWMSSVLRCLCLMSPTVINATEWKKK